MCVLTAIRPVTEVLVRYEDHTVSVAYELACGCVKLRPATLADLERLPLLDADADSAGVLGGAMSPWEDGPDDSAVLPIAA